MAIALPAPPAPTRSTRARSGRAPWSFCAFTKASPSSMSPCQVRSGLRRMTLTTPSLLARSEVVAQWAKAVNLLRHGDQDSVDVPRGRETRHDGAEVIGRHLHRHADAVVAALIQRASKT